MRRPVTLALRFAAVIIALGLIHLALTPAGPANSPYLSALSSLSAPAAEAATHCANKTCAGLSGGCTQATGHFCAHSGGPRLPLGRPDTARPPIAPSSITDMARATP